MKLAHKEKCSLSKAAMGIAASNLGSDGQPLAMKAIMAAARHDAPFPLEFARAGDRRGRAVSVAPGITWVVGCTGSGKKELIHAALRDVARKGYRSVHVTGTGTGENRWHPSEGLVLQAGEDWKDSLAPSLIRALRDPAVMHIKVVLPSFYKSPDGEHEERAAVVAETLMAECPGDCVLAFEDVEWTEDVFDRLLTRVRASPGPNTIIALPCFWRNRHMVASIDPREAMIVMKMDVPFPLLREALPQLADDAVETCRRFEAGEGWLLDGPAATRIIGDYEFSHEPARVLEGTPLGQAMERLGTILETDFPSSNLERLDTVARACGYRNWEAAQARA